VNVIGCAVDDERGCVHFADEDQVKDEIAGGVRHVSFAPSELCSILRMHFPRLAPWAAFLRRFAAEAEAANSGKDILRTQCRNTRNRGYCGRWFRFGTVEPRFLSTGNDRLERFLEGLRTWTSRESE
jgi:hypothetical protein